MTLRVSLMGCAAYRGSLVPADIIPRPGSKRRAIMPNKDAEAQQLADFHYHIEPGIVQVFRLMGSRDAENRPEEPIKLLKVTESTLPVGILPMGLRPMPERGL